MARAGEAAISHKSLEQMLKGESDVGGDDSKAKYLSTQALESQNLHVFVWMLKGDT